MPMALSCLVLSRHTGRGKGPGLPRSTDRKEDQLLRIISDFTLYYERNMVQLLESLYTPITVAVNRV